MFVLVLLKSGARRSCRISSFVHEVTDTHVFFFSDLATTGHHRIHGGSIVDRCFAATITQALFFFAGWKVWRFNPPELLAWVSVAPQSLQE